jgi:putative flavoprotein involved in K+ transport
MDAYWWLEVTGRLARTIDDMPDPEAARREPSLQLVGRGDPARSGEDLDLASLQARGVRLVGRVAGLVGTRVELDDNLADDVASSERRMRRFLDAADRHASTAGLSGEVWPAYRPAPLDVPRTPRSLDLRAERISTVVVAAGYRPDHHWLRLPLTGPDGHILQRRGRTAAPGVYVVGQRFQHRRDSALIDGARHDARAVVAHLLHGSSSALAAWPQEPAL